VEVLFVSQSFLPLVLAVHKLALQSTDKQFVATNRQNKAQIMLKRPPTQEILNSVQGRKQLK
jgi:hypothetical protein